MPVTVHGTTWYTHLLPKTNDGPYENKPLVRSASGLRWFPAWDAAECYTLIS